MVLKNDEYNKGIKIETVETVGVVVFNKDKSKVLLVQHLPAAEHLTNTFGIPAGRLEAEQSLAENAARELREETGLLPKGIDLEQLPFTYEADISRKDGSIKHFHLRTFRYICLGGELKESAENRPVWVQLENIRQYNLLPNVASIILDALSFDSNESFN